MKLKKIIALLLSSSLLIATLTACATEGETSEDTEATEATQTTETFDFSEYFDEKGNFEGITATDYVTLPDYKTAQLPSDTLTATEEEIASEVDAILSSYTTTENITDESYTIADGDTVNIDYVGSVDGVEFEGGSTGGAGTDVTIGVTQYIDDFLEQLIGHTPGENFDIEVTFPEDYGVDELNGKDAVFNITINHGYNTIVPELNDEFVTENFDGVYTTAQEILDIIEENIIYNKQITHLVTLLSESEVSEYPTELIEYTENLSVSSISAQASQYGMDSATYLSLMGFTDVEAYIEANEEVIEETAKSTLIFQAINETEEFDITEDVIIEYSDLLFGTGSYDIIIETYGENYIAHIVSQEYAIKQLHIMLIENTDGATIPDFYITE